MVSLRSTTGIFMLLGVVSGQSLRNITVVDDADPPQTPSSNAQALASLQKCSPCGASQCSFSPQESPSYDTYRVIIGKPVSNCDDETDDIVTSKYTSEMVVTETWSVDSSIGVSLGGLSVLGGAGWSKSAGVKASQEVSFSVSPGKMAALTANISYKKTSGNLFIDSTPLSFSSLQPMDVQSYNVEYADCGDPFDAFPLRSTGCSATSAAYLNRCSHWLLGLLGIMSLWSMI